MASVVNGNHLNVLQDNVLVQGEHDLWLGAPGETVGALDGHVAQVCVVDGNPDLVPCNLARNHWSS